MSWPLLAASVVAGLVLAALLSFGLIRWLGRREPYASFLRLRTRRKLTFFYLLLRDGRVPLYIRMLPIVVIAYLASPVDLLPGIVLDDVALALLALVLIIRFTPRQVLLDLVQRAASADVPPAPGESLGPETSNAAEDCQAVRWG